MNVINASITKMEEIEIFGIPALYTPHKVSCQTVHLGMYCSELQAAPEDWGQPCRLMNEVDAVSYTHLDVYKRQTASPGC